MIAEPLDPLWTVLAVALIAVLFAHAAAVKFADLEAFELHLAAYRVPPMMLRGLARALPAAEALVVLALVSPLRGAGAALAAALLLVYAGAMAWQRAHGRRLDCGCGGAPLPVSWWLVGRNVLLAALALPAGAATTGRDLALTDALIGGGAVVLASLLYAAFNQVLRQSAAAAQAAASR